MRKIKLNECDVVVTEGNTVTAIKIDEKNELYQQLKAETNNFTANMNQNDELETLAQTQVDLIFQLMMNGVI
jgi:hypothetical protein